MSNQVISTPVVNSFSDLATNEHDLASWKVGEPSS